MVPKLVGKPVNYTEISIVGNTLNLRFNCFDHFKLWLSSSFVQFSIGLFHQLNDLGKIASINLYFIKG